jgi:glycosyltransferase involved in cell wall biosynthesis
MPHPVRVLHLLASLGAGGAETLVMNAFRRIDRTQVLFDAALYTTEPGFYDDEFQGLGGRIFRLPYPDRRTLVRYGYDLHSILTNEGPFAAVHSHLHSFNGLPLLLARASGVPVRIAHSHSTNDGKPVAARRRWYHGVMRGMIHANATHLVGCSASACAELFGKRCARSEVLRNAIDPDNFPSDEDGARDSIRATLGLGKGDFALAHVGKFEPPKNHARVIDIFAELTRIMPQARLFLVGAGPSRVGIEERCRALGLEERVTFLGLRKDVPRVLPAYDAFVFPSLYEGLGLAVVEAQMAGLPCVVSEAVPHEADLGLGLLRRLSLATDSEIWASEIFAAAGQERRTKEDRDRQLLRAGFDMRQAVQRWEALYLRR